MRTLIINRAKSFVGCLAKSKIYIENVYSPETTICGVPCSKLGEVKNGSSATFQIGEGEARIFVIADKLSKNYCAECFQLYDGYEGEVISLNGKCVFNPGAGNAFRFDNNETPEAIEVRKKGKKGWLVLLLALIAGFAVGFGITYLAINGFGGSKDFTTGTMTITLDKNFTEVSPEDYSLSGSAMVIESKNVFVSVVRDGYEAASALENYTVTDYAELIRELYGREDCKLNKKDELVWIEYDYQSDVELHYFVYFYKSDDALWCVNFVVESKNAGKYRSDVKDWAKSVKFD